VRRVVLVVAVAVGALALGVARAGALLSPAEQKWAEKVINVYNIEAAALNNVVAQEKAPGALVAASGAANTNLTKTLVVFASCPTWMRQYGKPPTARLMTFDADMVASCGHLYTGARDVAHAIGEFGLKNGPKGRGALAASFTELKAGSRLLAAAERQLAAIGKGKGGSNPLAA
jgi:hypothetical protein